MSKFENLRARLKEFDSINMPEMKLAPIEKFMFEELGVERLKLTGGSSIKYQHKILKRLGRDGLFTVHKSHKKREIISRFDYRKYLRPRLLEIIDLMEMEDACGNAK
ncbi:MAG: hypothetical protein AB1483_06325 [Candidatus Zixiibacteriota bacterium]